MSVMEILEQAQTLSLQERKELAKLLIDTLNTDALDTDVPPVEPSGEPEEHWGKSVIRLLNEMGPIEMIHPEIEDATEWVRQIRRDQELQRGINWDEAE